MRLARGMAPAPEGPAQGAFGWPDRSFTQWLQYDLLPRLREVAAGREDPPEDSMVGTKALREFDGLHGRRAADRCAARARPAGRRTLDPPTVAAGTRHYDELAGFTRSG